VQGLLSYPGPSMNNATLGGKNPLSSPRQPDGLVLRGGQFVHARVQNEVRR
jgi:hypothetical protein